MTPYGFIYISTNLINGKQYLGMCAYHRSNHSTYIGSGKALRRAIKKYGTESFSRETIAECATKMDMITAEIFYISQYNCVTDPMWYNIAHGGFSTKGFSGKKHSAKTKALMRKNHKRPINNRTKHKFKQNGKIRSIKLMEYRRANPDLQNKKLIFNDIFYESIGDCVKDTGLSWNTVTRRIKKPPKAILAYNNVYNSISHAARVLGVSYRCIATKLLDSDNTDVVLYKSVYKFL